MDKDRFADPQFSEPNQSLLDDNPSFNVHLKSNIYTYSSISTHLAINPNPSAPYSEQETRYTCAILVDIFDTRH
jgi:hypothetical protein